MTWLEALAWVVAIHGWPGQATRVCSLLVDVWMEPALAPSPQYGSLLSGCVCDRVGDGVFGRRLGVSRLLQRGLLSLLRLRDQLLCVLLAGADDARRVLHGLDAGGSRLLCSGLGRGGRLGEVVCLLLTD